ncbi:MAG: agmatine deiminase family protein [Prevotella sp.]|nr:agmatine deiminase family protein [Prevotella sp.]
MRYILPAEWYPQSGIQLTWPHEGTDWRPYLSDITKTFVEIVCDIVRFEKVLIVAPAASIVEEALSGRIPDELRKRVIIHECDTNDTWARDHGAITLLPDTEDYRKGIQQDDALLLDFQFNGWGEKFPAALDNQITSHLCERKAFHGTRISHDDFVLEGGSIESDGKGTIFTTSQCLLAPHRNQPLDRKGIERQLIKRLHAQRIVWLDHGNLLGDDTDGHIDTIVRIAPNDTLLFVKSENENDPQHADFQALERQLQSLLTIEGKPYRLLPLPMPDAIYDDGERLPATYANFLVLNEAVLCPTYAQPHHDGIALQAIAAAFPHHEIIPIDARTIIRQHGSIHCLTMQYPIGVI